MVFNVLDKTSMKLNLEKYTLRVRKENFLGYIVSKSGIEANPDKLKPSKIWKHPSIQMTYRS